MFCVSENINVSNRIILDNGSGCIKAGFAYQFKPRIISPNCIGQVRKKTNSIYYGENVYTIPDYFCHRPHRHGLLVDVDMQRDIWQSTFSKNNYNNILSTNNNIQNNSTTTTTIGGSLNIKNNNFNDYAICITEPYLNLASIRYSICEIVFEDFGFQELLLFPSLHVTPFAFSHQFFYDNYNEYKNNNTFSYYGDQLINNKKNIQQDIIKDKILPTVTTPDKRKINIIDGIIGKKKRKTQTSGVYNEYNNKINNNNNNVKQEIEYNILCLNSCSSNNNNNRNNNQNQSYNNNNSNKKNKEKINTEINNNNNIAVRNPCSLVVDCGFSFSSVMPFFEFSPLEYCTLRSDIGGMHLNAYMKNLLSFRHFNMEQNELLVQHIKEETCCVALNFIEELKEYEKIKAKNILNKKNLAAINRLAYEYELPDYNVRNKNILLNFFSTHRNLFMNSYERNNEEECNAMNMKDSVHIMNTSNDIYLNNESEKKYKAGSRDISTGMSTVYENNKNIVDMKKTNNATQIDEKEKILLCNERISVPEILFNPQDVEMRECGVAELIYRSIIRIPYELRPYFAQQIILVGGSTKFKGFKERLYKELRCLLPENWKIGIYQEEDASSSVWRGLKSFAENDFYFQKNKVTKAQYQENGYLNRS